MDDLVKNYIKDKPEYSSFEGCALIEITFKCCDCDDGIVKIGTLPVFNVAYGGAWYSHSSINKVKYCLENLEPRRLRYSSPNPYENWVNATETADHIEVSGKSTDRLIEEIKKSRPGKTLTDKRI